MRNLRHKHTAMVAVLLLSSASTTWSAVMRPEDLAPDTDPSSAMSRQEPVTLAVTSPSEHPVATSEAQLKNIVEGTQAKLNQLHAAAGFPGATIGFVLPDGRSSAVSTGVTDLATKRPLVPNDLLLAGSIGKTFAAAVMIQLAQEGKLSLDDRIVYWFKADPWFARLPNASEITIRMLLNHSSGLAHHPDNARFLKALRASPDRHWKPEELITFVLNKKPPFAAGKGFSYSDTNYILAGMIIERVTGSALYTEVTRRFLQPLKLEHIVPQQGRIIPGLVNGYSSFAMLAGPGGAMIVDGKLTINPQVEWAGGGFAANAEDLARWAKSLYEGGVIKQPYMEQMLAGMSTGEPARYGLGVELGEGRWGKTYGHDGLFPGYVSAMSYFPQYRVAVAMQINTDQEKQLGKDLTAYIDDVMKIIVGELTVKKVEEPQERQAVVLDPKIYDGYVGQYEIEPGVILNITRASEHLLARVTGQDAGEIYPSSETEYFSRRVDAQIKFVKNEEGKTTGLAIVQSGRKIPARKIK